MASEKDVQMIMALTGVDEVTASKAYLEHEVLEDAIASLLPTPVVSGDKYIPKKPTINNGLTPDQAALCKRGRWLQDQVNVVVSVAHSKIRTPLDPPEPAESRAPPSSPEQMAGAGRPESPQGSDAQSLPPAVQSETLPKTHS